MSAKPKKRRKVTQDKRRRAIRPQNPVVGGDRNSATLEWFGVIEEPPVRGDGKP